MSDYEGNPKALLEAMSAGLICIVKKTSSYEQPIVHNFNGFLVSSSFSDFEINSLSEALSNAPLLQRISVNARNTIINQNSLESYSSKLYNICSND